MSRSSNSESSESSIEVGGEVEDERTKLLKDVGGQLVSSVGACGTSGMHVSKVVTTFQNDWCVNLNVVYDKVGARGTVEFLGMFGDRFRIDDNGFIFAKHERETGAGDVFDMIAASRPKGRKFKKKTFGFVGTRSRANSVQFRIPPRFPVFDSGPQQQPPFNYQSTFPRAQPPPFRRPPLIRTGGFGEFRNPLQRHSASNAIPLRRPPPFPGSYQRPRYNPRPHIYRGNLNNMPFFPDNNEIPQQQSSPLNGLPFPNSNRPPPPVNDPLPFNNRPVVNNAPAKPAEAENSPFSRSVNEHDSAFSQSGTPLSAGSAGRRRIAPGFVRFTQSLIRTNSDSRRIGYSGEPIKRIFQEKEPEWDKVKICAAIIKEHGGTIHVDLLEEKLAERLQTRLNRVVYTNVFGVNQPMLAKVLRLMEPKIFEVDSGNSEVKLLVDVDDIKGSVVGSVSDKLHDTIEEEVIVDGVAVPAPVEEMHKAKPAPVDVKLIADGRKQKTDVDSFSSSDQESLTTFAHKETADNSLESKADAKYEGCIGYYWNTFSHKVFSVISYASFAKTTRLDEITALFYKCYGEPMTTETFMLGFGLKVENLYEGFLALPHLFVFDEHGGHLHVDIRNEVLDAGFTIGNCIVMTTQGEIVESYPASDEVNVPSNIFQNLLPNKPSENGEEIKTKFETCSRKFVKTFPDEDLVTMFKSFHVNGTSGCLPVHHVPT